MKCNNFSFLYWDWEAKVNSQIMRVVGIGIYSGEKGRRKIDRQTMGTVKRRVVSMGVLLHKKRSMTLSSSSSSSRVLLLSTLATKPSYQFFKSPPLLSLDLPDIWTSHNSQPPSFIPPQSNSKSLSLTLYIYIAVVVPKYLLVNNNYLSRISVSSPSETLRILLFE